MSVSLNNFILVIIFITISEVHGQQTMCGNEYKFNDSLSRAKTVAIDRAIAQYLADKAIKSRSEIIIPIVVHIVWYKHNENISDAIVLSQIEAINKDFNAENTDIQDVPDAFKSAIGNVGIRFCLAAVDPQGNPSTGITRTQTNQSEIGLSDDLFFSAKEGSDAWNTDEYLNIWVANTGSLISGFGTYPNQTLPEKTGVVIHPKYFGINGHSKYGLGRTLTHEIGHYLGLKHLWADDFDCGTDDEVEDTPVQKSAHTDCPNYPQSGCAESEMFMNFMDYVDDDCMMMFTQGQVDRMLAVINIYKSGFLFNQPYCLTPNVSKGIITISPNPSWGRFDCIYAVPPMGIIQYELLNNLGQQVLKGSQLVNDMLTIDVQELPSGIYFLKISDKTYKIMKY